MSKYIVDVSRYGSVAIALIEFRETEKMYIVLERTDIYGMLSRAYNGAHLRKTETPTFDTAKEAVEYVVGKLEVLRGNAEKRAGALGRRVQTFSRLLESTELEGELQEMRRDSILELLGVE